MSDRLPVELYTAAQTRALDAAIIQAGTPGFELMQRAARAGWRALQQHWPQHRQITVLCGGGNNGGDGYLIARLAQQAGWQVEVLTLVEPQRLQGDAALAWQAAREAGVPIRPWQAATALHGVVVDALLGTGLQGEVRSPWREAIEAINASGLPVLAVDIPSGLDADRGCVLGVAVRAEVTVSFVGLKPGLLTGAGPDLSGELQFAALAEAPAAAVQPWGRRLTMDECLGWLPLRRPSAHKGLFGHLLLIGGEHGMGGAVALAAEAALRSGAGRVSVLTRTRHVAGLLARCPEVMVHAWEGDTPLPALLEQADCVAVGPGLGQGDWGRQLLQAVLALDCPRLLDADALNLLAQSPQLLGISCLITPHPAEAGRLLGVATGAVQADRPQALQQLQQRYGCAVVLKGAGSLVGSPDSGPWLCSDGNPGMAVAGMGDVLSGICAALLAQGLTAGQAAALGVLLHAQAGDRIAMCHGRVGMLAGDLLPVVRDIINQREQQA